MNKNIEEKYAEVKDLEAKKQFFLDHFNRYFEETQENVTQA